ncbi:MAG: protein kinase [Sandaracinaceae bacterium]
MNTAPGTVLATPPPELAIPATDSGVFQTSPGMLRRRALGPWAEGIKQYLAIRIGDAQKARAGFRSLLRLVHSMPTEELIAPPGARAQAYRLARVVIDTERAMPGFASIDPVRFRFGDGARGRALVRLRAELDERDSELLELRHARELDLDELAFVLDLPRHDVELALDTAEARARQILGGYAPELGAASATAYLDAFAVQRSWHEGAGVSASFDEDDEGLEVGTLIGGRYELIERVGVGAFGDVYRASDVEVPGHIVALKMLRTPALSESARQSALRELKLNAAVFHPSLVQFKDHGWFDQRLWFVMPWYDGETLEARMRRGKIGRPEARAIFEPLARALAALHAAGIRHQDIKPDNILLARLRSDGDDTILPVLIDLGVAAKAHESMLGGTPLYFAPEVAKRFLAQGHVGPEVDQAADVFALALSLRNALEPDTQDEVASGAVRAFVAQRIESPPESPKARELRYLRGAFDRWLAVDPLDRPTASELASELAILTAPEERRERRQRVLRWLLPLLTVLAVSFALVVYALDRRAAREEDAARRARAETADARADLLSVDAARRALEDARGELQRRYEQSRMSRSELAEELRGAQDRASSLADELAAARRVRDGLRARLETREAALALAEANGTRLANALEASHRRAERAEHDRDEARERGDRLASERDSAQERARREQIRADGLNAELFAAQTARDDAESELTRLRAEIRSLAGRLATESEPAPSSEPPTDSTD